MIVELHLDDTNIDINNVDDIMTSTLLLVYVANWLVDTVVEYNTEYNAIVDLDIIELSSE
jgi:hypothetical protein